MHPSGSRRAKFDIVGPLFRLRRYDRDFRMFSLVVVCLEPLRTHPSPCATRNAAPKVECLALGENPKLFRFYLIQPSTHVNGPHPLYVSTHSPLL